MKSENRLARKKARKRIFRKRLTYGAIIVAVIVLVFFIASSRKSSILADNFLFKAAIVDQLSKGGIVPWPNQTFIDSSINILQTKKFEVANYSYEEATVNFYMNLSERGYGLIILRVHSAIVEGSTLLGLFTSEIYNNMTYPWQQSTGQLVKAFHTQGGPVFFAVAPGFVDFSMQGAFQNTIIILMGCDGMKYTNMAEAFVRKGAKVCIGWSGFVDAEHTDKAISYLLKCLVTYRYNVNNAVNETMQVMGPAPVYNSTLKYYPASAGDFTIPPYTGLTSNIAEIAIFLTRETERISPIQLLLRRCL